MTPPRLRRRTLVGIVGIAGIALLVGGLLVVHARSASEVRSAAREYLDLIAHGGGDDLQRLWAMEYTDDPGAMRSAGVILLGATQRIEVLGVGSVHTTERPDSVSYDAPFSRFSRVDVSYRLDGQDRTGSIVLGAGDGYSGTAAWRVVQPLTGSIAWQQASFADAQGDAYVAGIRQVRRNQLFSDQQATVQPLYPAVYPTQARLGPYFASRTAQVAVPAGEPTKPPSLATMPTARTKRSIRAQVLGSLRRCAVPPDITADCPEEAIAEGYGGVWWDHSTWWRGLVRTPTVVVNGTAITIKGGAFRMRVDGAARLIRFDGTGRYVIDNQSWTPRIYYGSVELREVYR